MSYLEYYGLKEQPFSISVDNRFYYNSAQHGEAIIRLKYAVESRKGLVVLVGDIGTGKTTLATRMLDEMDEKEYECALLIVIHGSITSEWLLRKIAVQLGVEEPNDDKTELLSQLFSRLIQIYESGKRAVVLIDEAQMLNKKEVMEEFRGILNIEMDGNKLITFVFFGLPDLDKNLNLDEPLKQRVGVRFQLRSFTEEITNDYVKYRLQIAGSNKELFTKDALSSIHKFSGGIPRLINAICDNALLEGFLRKKETVSGEMIEEVASDLKVAL
ncbi:MAG TPA: AAA family ATPase [Nitrospiria bacterium]|jgi:type II secretory pathway predicted ATPase ExeA